MILGSSGYTNVKKNDRTVMQFLLRVSTLTRDIDIAFCLSVRDVPGLDENGLTYCHSLFTMR